MKVLVLGTSHAATLRRAFPAIAAAYPGLSLCFWGLPSAAFAKAAVGADGQLRPDPEDAISRRKAAEWNGQDSIDLAPFDRILLVGLRYGLRPILQMMRSLQPLEWGRRRGALGVSKGFLQAAIRADIKASLRGQNSRTPFDARFVALPAPYPATIVLEPGELYQPVTRAVAGQKSAADLMEIYEAELARAHAAVGISFVPQPRETIAQPWLSLPDHLEDAARDARHMNADYGLIAFDAIASHCPDLSGQRLQPPARPGGFATA
ncbi:MAG: hypothetical protein K9G71_19795 [Rhodobacteraceae bacterium]|nr:hypothetical protein [Paracoccaceae bacterium]MCF8516577.1 hypothetical protein [Paracoccaceae bacterium]MCF8520948.1 hypothetical protein [Paracoccaceae bacterium]